MLSPWEDPSTATFQLINFLDLLIPSRYSEVGSWGYIEAVQEIITQAEAEGIVFDDIVVSTGMKYLPLCLSLNTLHLQHFPPSPNDTFPPSYHIDVGCNCRQWRHCRGVGHRNCTQQSQGHYKTTRILVVSTTPTPTLSHPPHTLPHTSSACDNAEYFHKEIDGILQRMGGSAESLRAKDLLNVVEGYVGLGYAKSSEAELKFIIDIARKTGVVVDPVYSGKALYGLHMELQRHPEAWKGHKILFIHTGGGFGLFPKKPELAPLFDKDEVQQLIL